MKNLLTLLLILLIIGILWLGSGLWKFSREVYVNPELEKKAVAIGNYIDLEYLKKEFEPAYEF
jgi:hypothetical protein